MRSDYSPEILSSSTFSQLRLFSFQEFGSLYLRSFIWFYLDDQVKSLVLLAADWLQECELGCADVQGEILRVGFRVTWRGGKTLCSILSPQKTYI